MGDLKFQHEVIVAKIEEKLLGLDILGGNTFEPVIINLGEIT